MLYNHNVLVNLLYLAIDYSFTGMYLRYEIRLMKPISMKMVHL